MISESLGSAFPGLLSEATITEHQQTDRTPRVQNALRQVRVGEIHSVTFVDQNREVKRCIANPNSGVSIVFKGETTYSHQSGGTIYIPNSTFYC